MPLSCQQIPIASIIYCLVKRLTINSLMPVQSMYCSSIKP